MRKVESPYTGPERRTRLETRRMVDAGLLDIHAVRAKNGNGKVTVQVQIFNDTVFQNPKDRKSKRRI